jgi:hypothetical protein
MRYVTGLPKAERDARFMVMLQGYFDESGTEGNDKVVSLAGFVITADRWTKFSDAWGDLLKRYNLPVFKMRKESKRRPVKSRDARIAAFADVIKQNLLFKIECSVSVADFREMIKGKLFSRNRNARIVDEYYLWIFHNLIARLCEGIWDRGYRHQFDVFFDEQLKYGPQATKFYRIALDVAKPRYRKMLPNDPIFRRDDEFMPLQAADMFAWLVRKYYNGILSGQKAGGESKRMAMAT